jgi:hypothetical protein
LEAKTYQTGVSSIFSSSASRYVIRYNHIALITLSARDSSDDHSGSRGWSAESTMCFPLSIILEESTPFSKDKLGRASRMDSALFPRGPGISTCEMSLPCKNWL